LQLCTKTNVEKKTVITQFAGDSIDSNIVSIYGNTLMKVVSPAPLSAHDLATVTECQYGEVKAMILKAADIKILPFTSNKHTGINSIKFLPMLSFSVTQNLSAGDTLWAAGWVLKVQDPDFQHCNWNGWMNRIHADHTGELSLSHRR